MEGFPDPEEEYEMMYAEEMEAMRDMERAAEAGDGAGSLAKKAKKGLDFVTDDSAEKADEDMDVSDLLNSSITGSRVEEATNNTAPKSPRLQLIQEEMNRTRKRKATEDLFGDIEDIEREEMYSFDFGEKDDEAAVDKNLQDDLRLIARIREERQKLLSSSNLLPNNAEKKSAAFLSFGSDYISSRVPHYPFITMRNLNSDKFYLRLKSEEALKNEIKNLKAKASSLLPVSFNDTWKEAEGLLEKIKMSSVLSEENQDSNPTQHQVTSSEKLWVEKYQPHSYRELLSDEGTNKTVLKWLKMWDQVVFNKKRPEKKVVAVKIPDGKFSGGKIPFRKLDEEFDSYGRPMQKIALLSGPPGLGKTTLAHILAKHAGYNPVEVNASDDSSADTFRLLLEASTQMKSVMGDDPRPNCLILDEIDGTPTAAIEVLLKFISDKDIGKGKKKKGSKPQILKRPIICICNDLYVPALRQLKQQALIINFPPIAGAKLAQRLLEISKREQLKTDLGTLLLLCDKTGNDVRSCLSFLHFFKTKNKQVGLMDVQKASVGQKDTQKGLFAVWHEMFQIVKPKNSRPSDTSQRGRLFRIVRIIQSYGEYEFLSHGVYENYLFMKQKETGFRTINYGTSWFCYFDFINTMIKQQQNYSLMPYLPYCFATWHLLYAGLAWPKINFPSRHFEVKSKTQQNVATLSCLLKGMDPRIRSGIKANELLTDILPMLLHLIIPNLKVVNAQLLSAEEKTELQRVVNIFVEFSLSFVQERTASGEMLYRIEPNVGEVVQFADVAPAPAMIYSVKQLVGHEVDSEKLRRTSLAAGTHHVVDTPTRIRSQNKAVEAASATPNHLQTLSPQILKKGPLKPSLKNWISITRAAPTASQIAEAKEEARQSLNDIAFCYKEGYSNAVRKTIKISELI